MKNSEVTQRTPGSTSLRRGIFLEQKGFSLLRSHYKGIVHLGTHSSHMIAQAHLRAYMCVHVLQVRVNASNMRK